MLKFFLFLFIFFVSYGAAKQYPFKTLNPRTGEISSALRKTLENLDFPSTLSASETLSLLEKHYKRKPGQERHQLTSPPGIEKEEEGLLESLISLDMRKEILPSEKSYDFIIILGATVDSMRERTAFLLSLLKRKIIVLQPRTRLFFITGDRDLFPNENILESKEHSFVPDWVIPSLNKLPQTEQEAASVVLDQMIGKTSLRDRIKILVSPKRYDKESKKWVRPHTGNTIETLIEHIKDDLKNKKLLFISNNPYVFYQHAVISREFMDQGLSNQTIIETVGPETRSKISIIDIDNVRNTLQRELEVWQRLYDLK